MTTKSSPVTEPIQVLCSSTLNEAGQEVVRYQIQNVTDSTLYIFDSSRMPYLLLEENASLVILHGINRPNPGKLYNMIEIPTTQPLQPGEEVNYEMRLVPLYLKDHYETQHKPTELHGSVSVHCQVGWGETPILESERHTYSINSLLEWQHITEAEPIVVNLP